MRTTHMTETELALRLSVLYRECIQNIGDLIDYERGSFDDQQALQLISDTVDTACSLKGEMNATLSNC